MILEGIVTTVSAAGEVNIAPMGPDVPNGAQPRRGDRQPDKHSRRDGSQATRILRGRGRTGLDRLPRDRDRRSLEHGPRLPHLRPRDTLTGGTVLPGFQLSIGEWFQRATGGQP